MASCEFCAQTYPDDQLSLVSLKPQYDEEYLLCSSCANDVFGNHAEHLVRPFKKETVKLSDYDIYGYKIHKEV